jgi:hypothetical protein
MTRAKKTLALLAVATMLGLWGCTKGPSAASGEADRIKALEARIARLEDDYRAAAGTRDQLRKQLAAAAEQEKQLHLKIEELQLVVKERDDLRRQLAARVAERDNVQAQFEQFRKSIRDLLGEAEAALKQPRQLVTPSSQARRAGDL